MVDVVHIVNLKQLYQNFYEIIGDEMNFNTCLTIVSCTTIITVLGMACWLAYLDHIYYGNKNKCEKCDKKGDNNADKKDSKKAK